MYASTRAIDVTKPSSIVEVPGTRRVTGSNHYVTETPIHIDDLPEFMAQHKQNDGKIFTRVTHVVKVSNTHVWPVFQTPDQAIVTSSQDLGHPLLTRSVLAAQTLLLLRAGMHGYMITASELSDGIVMVYDATTSPLQIRALSNGLLTRKDRSFADKMRKIMDLRSNSGQSRERDLINASRVSVDGAGDPIHHRTVLQTLGMIRDIFEPVNTSQIETYENTLLKLRESKLRDTIPNITPSRTEQQKQKEAVLKDLNNILKQHGGEANATNISNNNTNNNTNASTPPKSWTLDIKKILKAKQRTRRKPSSSSTSSIPRVSWSMPTLRKVDLSKESFFTVRRH